MAKGDSKIDVRVIIRAHRGTYVDALNDRPRRRDNLLLEGLPVVGFVVGIALKAKLSPGAAVGLLTVTGLLSVLFFGLMLQVADRAMNWSDAPSLPGSATSSHATALHELAAHAGYASLVSIVAAIAYVVASVTGGWPLRVSSSLGFALGGHLVLVLFMVMKRVFLLTEGRLNQARTSPPQAHKRAS